MHILEYLLIPNLSFLWKFSEISPTLKTLRRICYQLWTLDDVHKSRCRHFLALPFIPVAHNRGLLMLDMSHTLFSLGEGWRLVKICRRHDKFYLHRQCDCIWLLSAISQKVGRQHTGFKGCSTSVKAAIAMTTLFWFVFQQAAYNKVLGISSHLYSASYLMQLHEGREFSPAQWFQCMMRDKIHGSHSV